MDVVEALHRAGGFSTRAHLIAETSRAGVDAALRSGSVVAGGRGRYALPDLDGAASLAHATRGVLCLTSAALHHGWEVKTTPCQPHVLYPRQRRLDPAAGQRVVAHRGRLHPDQVDGLATSAETTLEMCLRRLPFDEALAVADSALRHGLYPGVLRRISASVQGPGSPQVRRVCVEASGDAANPFESVLRAIALDVPGLRVRPQVVISTPLVWARPDLVDTDLAIVLEADSFAWHGDRAGLDRDARRYNRLVAAGYLVLRCTWEQVMFRPAETAELIRLVVLRRTEVRAGPRKVA